MNLIQVVAISDLFRKGEAVANKGAWKSGQISATVVGGVVVAAVNVAQAYGYHIPANLDADLITSVCAGLVSVVNVVLTWVTSESAGILPAKEQAK